MLVSVSALDSAQFRVVSRKSKSPSIFTSIPAVLFLESRSSLFSLLAGLEGSIGVGRSRSIFSVSQLRVEYITIHVVVTLLLLLPSWKKPTGFSTRHCIHRYRSSLLLTFSFGRFFL